jgi:hypothetical protein
MPATFSSVPTQYAPKRKFIDFARPKWHNKMGKEFTHPDVISWVNNTYQTKVFKTPKDFNEAYDARLIEVLYWRNKPMILTKEDVDNFEEEFNEGAFDEVKADAQKTLLKMRAALETGEKSLFVF